jgi:hypothetical protein
MDERRVLGLATGRLEDDLDACQDLDVADGHVGTRPVTRFAAGLTRVTVAALKFDTPQRPGNGSSLQA